MTKPKNLKPFEKIYEIVRRIPPGKVMTYGQIALQLNRKISPRVVGWALHANKDLNTPCHRVVDRNGRLAPNFAFDGWREQRKRLLTERVEFKDEMHVDIEKFLLRLS
ncbi:hypothetical protein A2W13_02715 [Candidatus Woesebacteria bacterium RBG_16_36_11]|uniref:Methylated-DNA-[protein]-cysteine S-methyltransferase DNA binding domain-containing protein n=3 Tax=Candidatus Woeseibacteriota TaxID=1752722 RepID=A0A1F7X7N9_9BACT|nr:MAG: hypothetical protein A2Z67_05610 [Candidatus Woesebacteria bacterium RBG_13_36_22]OGM11076.1 MAG: hypothetical protein A2W13_02715 [Candidatus Woesebacteria bacterium RBG_16_36_11]OGM17137.1 MAG: hypothetical protein A2V55_00340 [Candidatus Woesebacteria bacterium RBG_19FT_COMBO_37_29]